MNKNTNKPTRLKKSRLAAAVSAIGAAAFAGPLLAQSVVTPATEDGAALASAVPSSVATMAKVEIASRKTRSTVSMSGNDIQKVVPGVNPLKALESLPGVSFQTADPWGNNEQNLSLFVHGFNGQQLGYVMDGVPLGDQQYGNYNGLAPQRALTSENVGSVVLSTGAGDLGTASTSNLGGTIETYSSAPRSTRNVNVQQTVGSHNASRSFVRIDTGEFGDGNSAYISGLHHEAKAWDFNGRQSDDQVNAKFVHAGSAGKLTLYADYSDKTEPNEDATVHVAGEKSAPYTRSFLYPDFGAALAYLSPTGATPAADGNNYRNYYSDAQRTDYLTYAKYEAQLGESLNWSNQVYFHHNDGVGVVAGPIGVAGLPALFSAYYPNQNLKQVFGNSGYATRTTEYKINRHGWLSSLRWDQGDHKVEAGLWFEHNSSGAYRRWYALDVNNPSSPYTRPSNPLITQYGSDIDNKVAQFHLQDEWKLRPDLALQAGFKSSLQFANGTFPVQESPASLGSPGRPEGEIVTKQWFLPQVGVRWDLSKQDQLFANVQKNLRQFITYGGGGASPWSLGSQAAFDLFKASAKPETSITYELGLRDARQLDVGPVTAFDSQVSVYHVDFRDRQLSISPTPVISSIVGGAAILANVGSVKTDGIDLAGTLHFGRAFSFYDAVSYNKSTYDNDYTSGKSIVHTAGKEVPGTPKWMNKFAATASVAGVDIQLSGDFVGKRFATFTNDLDVASYFLMGLNVSGALPTPGGFLKNARWNLNVTNLANREGAQQVVVGAASGTYNTYPIAPRQGFLTVKADF